MYNGKVGFLSFGLKKKNAVLLTANVIFQSGNVFVVAL
jgi:hypothetical protein